MVIVRQAGPADAAAACSVLRRSITECCGADHGNNPAVLEAWLANKTPEGVCAWILSRGFAVVAERDGTMVGMAVLGADGTIALCYLVAEARFLGIGKAMLGALEDEAHRRGQNAITLSSTKTAHEFYRRNGYADTGKVDVVFGLSPAVMRKEFRARDQA